MKSDGAPDVQVRTRAEIGGPRGGTHSAQLFALGYAACVEGALGVIGRRERIDVSDVSIQSRVSLVTTENRGVTVALELHVILPQVADPEQAVRIVAAAHEVCPYSSATRDNIAITLTANGEEVLKPAM